MLTLTVLLGAQAHANDGWSFVAAPEFYFYRVDAKDINGFNSSLASKSISPGLSLGAEYGLGAGRSLRASMGFSSVDMKTSSVQDAIVNSNVALGGADVDAKFSLSEHSHVGVGIGTSRQFYIERANNTSLRLVLLDIPEVHAFYFSRVHQSELTDLGVEVKARSLFSASKENIKASSGFAGRVSLVATVPGLGIPTLAHVYYEHRQQDSNIEKWTSAQMGLALSMTLGGL